MARDGNEKSGVLSKLLGWILVLIVVVGLGILVSSLTLCVITICGL
jgi:hypothetical protein